MNSTGWIVFSIVILIIVFLGIINSSRVTTRHLYLLAGRQTKLLPLIATLVMTEFNTATLIAFAAFGYENGWRALTLPGVFLFGLLFYALTVAKKWQQFNALSCADFFSKRYGKEIAAIVRIILFSAMAGFTATYVKSLTLIFISLFPRSNPWGVSAILSFIILLTTLRGGLIAIIRTDVISFILILIFLPLLLYHIHSIPISYSPVVQPLLPAKFIISLIFLTMFSYILAPWYGQKITAANSPRTAVFAVSIAALLIFLLYSCAISVTVLLAKQHPGLSQPDQAFPFAIHLLPPMLQGLGYAVLFLAAATTLSGVWSAMVTLLISHYQNRQQGVKDEMVFTIFCALLSYLLANLLSGSIMNNMILANIPIVALSFSLLAGFYWKKANQLGVYASVIVGVFWGIGCYYYYGQAQIYTWYWAIYGIPLIFIAGWIGSLKEA